MAKAHAWTTVFKVRFVQKVILRARVTRVLASP